MRHKVHDFTSRIGLVWRVGHNISVRHLNGHAHGLDCDDDDDFDLPVALPIHGCNRHGFWESNERLYNHNVRERLDLDDSTEPHAVNVSWTDSGEARPYRR